nr:hypothetical protein [Tanacetum cinerariifolium]
MIIVQNESVFDTSDLQTELECTKECFENYIIKKENEYAKLWNDWYKKCDECKYDKISYDKAYKDMQQKIERLQAQLFKKVFDQKDNTQDTSKNTKFAKQPIVENLPKIGKTNALSNPVTSNSVSTPQESKGVNNDKLIALGMFRINPSKTSREEKHVPNIVSASARTKLITVSQPPVFTRKYVNSNLNGLSSTGPKVAKPKKVGTLERLATPKPRKPRVLLRWSPTGRLFDQEGKLATSSNSESQYDCSNEITSSSYGFVWTNENCQYKWQANDREDIGKLGAKGDIGFFIGYSADSCAYRIYNRRTKKIMETMNVSFDELSVMDFEQRSLKPGLNSMTSGHISSGLDPTYALSTITTQQPSEGELDLLFEAMYDDYIGGQPISRWRYNLTPAESKFKTPMLDHQDKYMMKAQVHVSKSSTISDEQPLPRKKLYRQHVKAYI